MDDKKLEEKEEEVPFGKVRLKDGRVIDRVKACFRMQRHKDDPTLLRSATGMIYVQDLNTGTMRRHPDMGAKLSKAEKKALKRARRNP